MRRRAAFTIVQNEPIFLPLWLRYYCRYFDPQDVFVLDHDGTDGTARAAQRQFGVNIVQVHRDKSFDHHWLCQTVARFQAFLLQSYRYVLFAEADELIAADPAHFSGLDQYIDAAEAPYFRCLGVNLVHQLEREPPLDWTRPVLAQRSTCYLTAMYNKALLARVPLTWEPGFHVAHGADAPPDPRLVLFHLHRADYAYCLKRHEASARRKWNEKDIELGMGVQNRIFEPAAFHQWFYHGHDLGDRAGN